MKYARHIAMLAAVLATAPVHAGSVAGTGGASEITQILNNSELVTQSAQMYQQVQNTIQQVMMEKQQLQNLVAAPMMEWGQAQSQLAALRNTIQQGQALGHSLGNIDQMFSLKFPGYSTAARARNFGDASKTWVTTSLDSIKSALNMAGLRADQFADEQTAMNNIQNIAATAPGQLKIAQAGVMVAGQQVQQLQKLSQLYAAQMQAQGAFMSHQADQQAFIDSENDDHFKTYHPTGAPTFSSSGGKN